MTRSFGVYDLLYPLFNVDILIPPCHKLIAGLSLGQGAQWVQTWLIVNWALRDKLILNSNQNAALIQCILFYFISNFDCHLQSSENFRQASVI